MNTPTLIPGKDNIKAVFTMQTANDSLMLGIRQAIKDSLSSSPAGVAYRLMCVYRQEKLADVANQLTVAQLREHGILTALTSVEVLNEIAFSMHETTMDEVDRAFVDNSNVNETALLILSTFTKFHNHRAIGLPLPAEEENIHAASAIRRWYAFDQFAGDLTNVIESDIINKLRKLMHKTPAADQALAPVKARATKTTTAKPKDTKKP